MIGRKLECDPLLGIIEVDGATYRKLEDSRELLKNVSLRPMKGKNKLYIIDEAHNLTSDAQDRWLKTLEDPPDNVYFVFCTTEYNKLKPAIRSRGAVYKVATLNYEEMKILLKRVCKKEKIVLSKKIRKEIYELSEGVPRDALIFLEQIKHVKDDNEAMEILSNQALSENSPEIAELSKALLKFNWKEAQKITKELMQDQEPETIRRAVLGYLTAVLFNYKTPVDNRILFAAECFEDNFFNSGKAGLRLAVYRACLKG